MAPNEPRRRRRVRRSASTRQRDLTASQNLRNDNEDEKDSHLSKPKDIDALRTARLQYLEKPIDERRKMLKILPSEYVGDTVTTTEVRTCHATVDDGKQRPSRRPISGTSALQTQRRRGRTSRSAPAPNDHHQYVYGPPPGNQHTHSATTALPGDARRSQVEDVREFSGLMSASSQTPRRRHTEPLRDRALLGADRTDSVVGSQTTTTATVRPRPKRSATQQPRSTAHANEQTTSTPQARRSSLFSGLFHSTPPTIEKKVTCLTCGSEVRVSNTAKLMCSHRMCHSCLKRIFNMSVKDPAHMPPKCCTSEHIPLKHVDKLFDDAFKKNWNRKYQEYNTRNRIYCPLRGCGEWIKPSHITLDHGRKVGKCKRCGTKVCCICNNRMHTSRDCPKDPETRRFVEVAKEKGWQRCFNCSAMVELKEGCNHMTCRCTAEFCMVCGSKWKSCDCPWFNYEPVHAHLGNPARYQEELDRRRDQERRDEDIARRMEVLGLDRPDMLGLGNARTQDFNQNFIRQAREALTANYQQAEQAAWGLLNGLMTGRENRLPGVAEPPTPGPRVYQQGHRHDPAEDGANETLPSSPAHRPTRRGTLRRHSAVAEVFSGRSAGR